MIKEDYKTALERIRKLKGDFDVYKFRKCNTLCVKGSLFNTWNIDTVVPNLRKDIPNCCQIMIIGKNSNVDMSTAEYLFNVKQGE